MFHPERSAAASPAHDLTAPKESVILSEAQRSRRICGCFERTHDNRRCRPKLSQRATPSAEKPREPKPGQPSFQATTNVTSDHNKRHSKRRACPGRTKSTRTGEIPYPARSAAASPAHDPTKRVILSEVWQLHRQTQSKDLQSHSLG